MKNTRKKKKQKPKPPKNDEEKKGAEGVVDKEEEEEERKRRILEASIEGFSLEESAMVYDGVEGVGDPDKASEIPRRGLVDNDSGCSSSSGGSSIVYSGMDLGSTSGSSDWCVEPSCGEDVACFKGGRMKKKVVAATGTVSTVLGKEYMRRNKTRNKGFSEGVVDKEEAEQFLCSMLGHDCDLDFALVRDVLCQCGYNVEKALDVLLDLAAPMNEQSSNDRHPDYGVDNIDDMRFLVDHNDSLIDRRSECTSLSSEGELSDNFWSLGSFGRPGCTKSDLSQKVLESLFNIPKSSERDKGTMNWRNVVKKMQFLGPGFDACPHVAESQQNTNAKGDEYHVFREDAKQEWDSVKSYYQKAATAYTKGDRAYAAFLSDQGKEQTKLAQKADTKASHDIFVARNKGIENVITIDLHGQHVKPAMRMLKLHLLFGSYIPSVQTLRVITGCGSHGVGKSKLKQSVISLLKKEAIEWSEENRGTVLIKLNGWREFSFLDTDSDSDSN
ncbi:SMR domain-containing protein At5g58720 isoform X2 [Gastrolobium bilobum]|uniref:SMR domain-containing protein At5g58720 isoform X2 n=1 Tax=Gastrolobium bilobum TaxID=150636 RepID=UPI002AAF81D1|nr:SMR domain-containing protein At5g58720 isoform X2 [Gastrolobium bilobum]